MMISIRQWLVAIFHQLILQYAKTLTPVVLMIDEMDTLFGNAENGHMADRHTQLVHTKDRKTFNDMLDAINDTPNIIAVFTTEKDLTNSMPILIGIVLCVAEEWIIFCNIHLQVY